MTTWNHKDEWRKEGKDFLVTVTRHSTTPSAIDPYEGPHRWAVYVYVYPKHPVFDTFESESNYQPATNAMPLHGGCSFFRVHLDKRGDKASVQVGADYHHLHDDEFTHYATKDDAAVVFSDAECLFDYLTEKGSP